MKKWLCTNDLYLPKLNQMDEYRESKDEYFLRIKKILPNFPKEVLIQWLYEHWNDIDNFSWLEFPKLNFESVEWPIRRIEESGIHCHETIKAYLYRFQNGTESKRMISIDNHFQSNGTWPVAPLLLKNVNGTAKYPNGLSCEEPYHPVEGHHRLAIFLAYRNMPFIKENHKIWLIGGFNS